ncbi:putative phosphoenolpyruvate synthase isoform X2 [Dendroctonus ponderosae]|uniref:putative phosphoenolpyruvate synthase isoform X2 n=1 Tax=Dendroctonus ponderosae TaxID=77166 RepID=UPI0020354C15|nr:putative phosphoenolpyruvate synthase isoform X2 [Dendroctonus ponderosae]
MEEEAFILVEVNYVEIYIFYPLKYYLAKKVVQAAQEKSRISRANFVKNDIEPEIVFTSQQSSHFQSFSGCDQKGNSLKLNFTLRPSKIADVILILKLASGSIFTFPDSQKVHQVSVKEQIWKINGLSIETLEPYRRLRIVFNGLLQNIACKTPKKIEHIQFNFIFNCCSAPKFYPEDCDTNLITETLATRPWKDASWKKFLNGHPDGYEQFGALYGFVKGGPYAEEQVLNLPACRTRYGGADDTFQLDREINIFLAEANGALIHLTLQSFKEEESQLNYGYICHKKFMTVPITGQDIKIQQLASNKTVPELFVARITSGSHEYTCVFNVNQATTLRQKSYSCYEIFNTHAECGVNNSQGKALLEFQYYEDKSNLKPRQLPAILSEKKVETLPQHLVVSIKSESAKVLEITGGKGNSLALLKSLASSEFYVPDGFIVTINAFKKQLNDCSLLREAVERIDEAFCGRSDAKREETCDLAVRLFLNEPVHPDIASDIFRHLNDVKMDTAEDAIDVFSWAVRSSAIGEDSEELSAAGQNETILGCVTENEVLKAVSKCWASLFTYQSVKYRWQHGLPVKSQMAVVVQKMVPAETAGVLFTWHPTTSNPSQMVVTSNFGLGESVVSGNSEPDTFILNRTHDGEVSLLDQVIGAKDKVLTLTENGVKEVSSPELLDGSFVFVNGKDVSENWSLGKEQVLKLGRVGVMLERTFGGPRDIEFAFFKGALYLLQSRPITTLSTWTDFELAHEQDSAVVTENSLYTRANCGEVYPLALSSGGRSILNYIDAGLQSYIYNELDPYLMKTLNVFQHRVFIDCIVSLYFIEGRDEITMTAKVLDLAIFGHPVINEKINATVRDRLGTVPQFENFCSVFRRWKDSLNVKQIVDKSREIVKNTDYRIKSDDKAQDIYTQIATNNSCFMPAYYHSCVTSASVLWQMLCMTILVGKEKELTTKHYADFANVLSSCEDVESAEVPAYLEKIAGIIKDEGYSEEFCMIDTRLGQTWLKSKCPTAHKIFEEFLDKHGHRCLGEFDLIQKTWGMDPSQVIPMIQANSRHSQKTAKVAKTIDQVISELGSPVNFLSRPILKYAISKLRVTVGKREQSKSALIMVIHKTRLAYLQLASAMVREGLMPSESLIFHLTKYEISQVIARRNPTLISKAIRRQKLYQTWNNLKFPELNYSYPQPEMEFQVPIELLPGSKCTGTPVCVGSVQARACVITQLSEIGSLQKGDILITYSTDIGWSPYFPMLSGVVTELGGLVSHGAVVAREYGLPCIVGVKNVTKIFKTGDVVYLSGKTGELGKV